MMLNDFLNKIVGSELAYHIVKFILGGLSSIFMLAIIAALMIGIALIVTSSHPVMIGLFVVFIFGGFLALAFD